MKIEIWTDGGCHENPGPGAWANMIIEVDRSKRRIIAENSGSEKDTTNNRMEIRAAIAALQYVLKKDIVKEASSILVVTDSEYVRTGMKKWISHWRDCNWKRPNNEPVKNRDLWETLDKLALRVSEHTKLNWEWVKAHSGVLYNERCDALVQKAMLKVKPK